MICTAADCTEHYACRVRGKGVQVSPAATPSRVRNRPQPHRPIVASSFEQGLVGETRCDGSFMPVLSPQSGNPMPVHEAAGQRTRIESGLRAVRSDSYNANRK